MNAPRMAVIILMASHFAATAVADEFFWNLQRTGFRTSLGFPPQTALSMRGNESWPVVYSVDEASSLSAYSLFPFANTGQIPIGPATNWHRIGTNITKGTLPVGPIYLQAASGSPDSFGVSVQNASSISVPPNVTVWGTSQGGFRPPQPNTHAIKFDEDGDAFVATTSMIPFPGGRSEVLQDAALSPLGDIGAITQQISGIGPFTYWQRSPLLGGAWMSSQVGASNDQSVFGPSADLTFDTSARPHVVALNRVSSANSVLAFNFNIMTGAWQTNTLDTTISSPSIADVAGAANDFGIVGAAWVNNGVLKYAYLDTNDPNASWVTTAVTSTTSTGALLEASQGVGLAYDKAGLPVISFVERSSRQIWIAYDPPLLTAPLTPGDFNDDGIVNSGDLGDWTAGMADGNSTGDSDADGDTDGADFLAWQQNVGGGIAAGAAAAAVPEPASFTCIVMAAVVMIGASRKGRA
jgi:hypothetical protein